jgi:hypothetical protein
MTTQDIVEDIQEKSEPQAATQMTSLELGDVDSESPRDDPVATPDFDALFSEMDGTSVKVSDTAAESIDHRVDDDAAIANAAQAMPTDNAQLERKEGAQKPRRKRSCEEDDAWTVDQIREYKVDTKHMKRFQSPQFKVESEGNDIGELWQQASAA